MNEDLRALIDYRMEEARDALVCLSSNRDNSSAGLAATCPPIAGWQPMFSVQTAIAEFAPDSAQENRVPLRKP